MSRAGVRGAALLIALCCAACADDVGDRARQGDPYTPNLSQTADMADRPDVDHASDPSSDLDTLDQNTADLAPDLAPDTDAPDLGPASRCVQQGEVLACPFMTLTLTPDPLYGPRKIHWQVPLGQPPSGGWPAAILFQGSLLSAAGGWDSAPGELYGMQYQTLLIQALLDAGFAVLTPETRFDGSTYWDSNVSPWNIAWTSSPDHALMLAMFEAVDQGSFGPLNGRDMRAVGISSGGYMASRAGLTYTERIRAIAVQSASYATCGGSFCYVPALDKTHPPTLLLHGELDPIVPAWTMRLYEAELKRAAIPHRVVTDPLVGHAWLPAAPVEVVDWFTR